MKKLFVILLSVSMATVTIESCSSTQGLASSLTGDLKSSIVTYLTQKLASGTSIASALQGATGSTPLSSILTNSSSISTFQSLISSKFQIPASKVSSSFSSLGNLNDVASFVGQNANASTLTSLIK